MQVSEKVFVVTGGGNGIGREVVLGLLRRGARVAAVDLREDSLVELATAANVGERLTLHPVNIADRDQVEALPGIVRAAHGQVDGLLNVAGIIQHFVPFADLAYDEMAKVLNVNLWGTIHTCKAFLLELDERPEACIVNVSSMGGFVPVPGQTIYGASKAAVKLFTEGLYAELRTTPIAVSIVYPGAIATNITGNSGVDVPGADQATAEQVSKSLPAPEAAEQIIRGAVEQGRYRLTVGKDATMLDLMSRLMPQRTTDLVAKKMASLLNRGMVARATRGAKP